MIQVEREVLIVQIEPPQNTDGGDYYYRTHAPGVAMTQQEGVYVINLTNEHRNKFEVLEQADVLILKNICDPDFLPLINKRKQQGKLTIYEIADDLAAIQPWNPVYFFYQDKENLDLVYRLANLCDALQVTCPELDRLYGHLNRKSRVFPNQISHVPAERPFIDKEPTIIGWAGSHGHLEDIEEIAPSLINWINGQPNACLHLMCSEPIWNLFDTLPLEKKNHIPTGSIDDYYRFLSGIDIGLGPLKDTPFNRSRSDVKFLEYAVSGVVPVVKNLRPYKESVVHGETGLLFGDSHELISILDRLFHDSDLIEKIAKAARRYVLKSRMEITHAQERLTFYREQHNSLAGVPSNGGRSTAEFFNACSNLEAAVTQDRHVRLASTKFETLLHDGLIAMQVIKDKALARHLFEEAAALDQINYLPHLFVSPVSPDPIKSIGKAVELTPDSLKAWIMLGEEFSRRGKIKEALECFGSAAEVFPSYEIPYLRAAEILERLGDTDQARKLFDRADQLAISSRVHN
jgi:tetratricopeptide (TPR) repeat protein